jgi:hypothetical protein
MIDRLPIIYLARHGETAWIVSGQHTGLTDLPLTEQGERNERNVGERLRGLTFARVSASPLQRAIRTCELACFGGMYGIDRDLVESDYEITYRHGSASYHVTVDNHNHNRTGRGVSRLTLDGQSVKEGAIDLVDDGKRHEVLLMTAVSESSPGRRR